MKSDAVVKSVVVAAIRRHSRDMPTWSGTHLWDDMPQVPVEQPLALALEDGEMPILYSVVGPTDWTLFTTRAVEFRRDGHRARAPLVSIRDVRPGNFKGYGSQQAESLTITLTDGTVHRCPYRTGEESMGTIYAINTLLRVGRAAQQ